MSRLLKNSTLYFVTDLSTKLATFVLLPLYTRLITPEQYGNIYLLTSLCQFLTVFISLTLSSAVSRYFFSCEDDGEVVNMYSSIIKFTFYLSTPVYFLLCLFGPYLFSFVKLDFYPYTFLILVSSYLSIFYLYISALLQAKQEAKRLSAITIFSSLFSLLMTCCLVIWMKDKVLAYLLSFLFTAIINFVIFLVFSREYFFFKGKDAKLKTYVKYAVSRMPVDLSSWVVTFADSFMIYEYKGEKDTGLYSIGYRLGQVVQLLFMAVNRAYVPFTFEKFAKAAGADKKELDDIAKNGVRLLALYFFLTFVGIIFTREIVLILDHKYQDSYVVMALILLSYLFLALKLLFQPPMDFKVEYVKVKSVLWISAALINIGLNIILIPKYSMNGAAFATFASYFIMLIPVIYFSNKAIPIKYDFKKIGIIIAISTVYVLLILLPVSLSNFLLKIFFTYIYFIILLKVLDFSIKDLLAVFYSFKDKRKING